MLKSLKTILDEIRELKLSRILEINEIENEAKRKLNVLDDEISNILQKLDVNLTTLELRGRFCKKRYDCESTLIESEISPERINRIKNSILSS